VEFLVHFEWGEGQESNLLHTLIDALSVISVGCVRRDASPLHILNLFIILYVLILSNHSLYVNTQKIHRWKWIACNTRKM